MSSKKATGEFDLRPAWRLGDPKIERDAIEFWNRVKILPADVRPEDRAGELVSVAYAGDRIVGVATAHLANIKTLRGRFGGLRIAVDPEHRRRGLGTALTVSARDLFEEWSLGHPEEKVLGMAAVVESEGLAERLREPVWPVRFNLAHFLPDGRQLRVAWFAHARLDPVDSGQAALPDQVDASAVSTGNAAEEFDLRPAWRRGDATIEHDAIEFWNRLKVLPADVRPEDRVAELAVVAYAGERIVGVATAEVGHIKTLRGLFAGLRCAVDPDHRRKGLAAALTVRARDLIEQWSLQHPEEKVLGLAALVESPDLAIPLRKPVWPRTGLNLAHFLPDGRQLRIAWFAHARLD